MKVRKNFAVGFQKKGYIKASLLANCYQSKVSKSHYKIFYWIMFLNPVITIGAAVYDSKHNYGKEPTTLNYFEIITGYMLASLILRSFVDQCYQSVFAFGTKASCLNQL